MKRLTALLFSIVSLSVWGQQEIVGTWYGALKVGETQLRIVFHVSVTKTGYFTRWDSPDQGAKGLATDTTIFEFSLLKITDVSIGVKYEGTLIGDTVIEGAFSQNGRSFKLDLSRKKIEKEAKVRPQDPIRPFPYYEEEVSIENREDAVTLAGTLTLPQKEGVFPAVILISGSGPQNRDEELFDHRPFLVLSDYLTKNGFAVLRFDDRGTFESTGDVSTATSFDFSKDVEACVNYLLTRSEINKNQIGLIGHSEGGMIAPMVASRNKNVAFIVLLAGPAIPITQLLLLQQEAIAKVMNTNNKDIQTTQTQQKEINKIVLNSTNEEQLIKGLTTFLKKEVEANPNMISKKIKEEDFIQSQINEINKPWSLYFMRYNPAPTLMKVKCPVLAINGDKDVQVPSRVNLNAIKKNLKKGGNKNVTVKELSGLNHLFQECRTGAPVEYQILKQTFSPIALEEILNWLKKQTK